VTEDATEEIHDSPTNWVARHIKRYVETDGRTGHTWYGVPTLLLTTRGRRSGRLHRTALIYGRDGGSYVVVASAGGWPSHPAWYLNLAADPNVRVQVGADKFTAAARTATTDERARIWPEMVSIWPEYERYQQAARRHIPVVLLEPRPRRRASAPDNDASS
jgi:deazaflavin-dependent oxidoreductase (nitroreductase family)